jgi:hypothetical protein
LPSPLSGHLQHMVLCRLCLSTLHLPHVLASRTTHNSSWTSSWGGDQAYPFNRKHHRAIMAHLATTTSLPDVRNPMGPVRLRHPVAPHQVRGLAQPPVSAFPTLMASTHQGPPSETAPAITYVISNRRICLAADAPLDVGSTPPLLMGSPSMAPSNIVGNRRNHAGTSTTRCPPPKKTL